MKKHSTEIQFLFLKTSKSRKARAALKAAIEVCGKLRIKDDAAIKAVYLAIRAGQERNSGFLSEALHVGLRAWPIL